MGMDKYELSNFAFLTRSVAANIDPMVIKAARETMPFEDRNDFSRAAKLVESAVIEACKHEDRRQALKDECAKLTRTDDPLSISVGQSLLWALATTSQETKKDG